MIISGQFKRGITFLFKREEFGRFHLLLSFFHGCKPFFNVSIKLFLMIPKRQKDGVFILNICEFRESMREGGIII